MWQLAEKVLKSRLLIGTALYPSPQIMVDAITASQSEVVTVSVRRQNPAGSSDASGQEFWQLISSLNLTLLPNTAGCNSAKEAITTANLA